MIAKTAHPKNVPHLIFAVLGAAVIVFACRLIADRLTGTSAPTQAAQQITRPASRPSNAAAEEDRLAAEAKQERIRREQSLIAGDKARRLEKEREIEAAQAQIAETARATEARKEQAWQRFYKKPRRCDNPPDNATLVECSNQYIREQQRFEALYAAGKL